MSIFHKTEIQTVILRCLTGRNLDWLKTYDTKCKLRPRSGLANTETDHQNLQLINGSFMTISGHLFANYMNIYHKTEIQAVILRCLIGTTVMTQNAKKTTKMQKTQMSYFFTKSQKHGNEKVCILCHNF